MGLASALSTALTGMAAAETTIDVVGNNLANSNTVGFKASEANFATQFLQTKSLGSSPTTSSGGTNPRQIGLGSLVAAITPNFSQGTIEISSQPTDLAIQGDGFFAVEGGQGEMLYTRNGIMKLNSANEMTTMGGNRLLGYGIDDNYQITRTELVPLNIPLGKAAVAAATGNVYLEGTLSPSGDVGTQNEIIQSGILTDGSYGTRPTEISNALAASAGAPGSATALDNAGGNFFNAGEVYSYKLVYTDSYYKDNEITLSYTEGVPTSGAGWSFTIPAGPPDPTDTIQLDLTAVAADAATGDYELVRVYRTEPGGTDFHYVGEVNAGGGPVTFDDQVDNATLVTNTPLDTSIGNPDGTYTYYYTYYDFATGMESKPSQDGVSVTAAREKIHLTDIPTAPGGTWTHVKIYRSLADDQDEWHEVVMMQLGADSYTDNLADTTIETEPEMTFNGPFIRASTLLTNLQAFDGSSNYDQLFQEGVLSFTPYKGDRALQTKQLTIDATTNVATLMDFISKALGIQELPGQNAGGTITSDSRIEMAGNYGVDNAIAIALSSFMLTPTGQIVADSVNMPFRSTQEANGESAVTDFLAYDSLGIPIACRVTAVMEEKTNTKMVWRWYADSPDNQELDPTNVNIAVGTGTITFNGEGEVVSIDGDSVAIDRNAVPSASPLVFELDFGSIAGLETERSSLAVSRQDGSAPGVLTSFIIGEEGTIRGIFSNGLTRNIGQVVLARFANPVGLEQKGENMYAPGVNSGLPVYGDPGDQGIGKLIAGAVELSNTDVGGNLIDLILASTMYRSNTRVISTSQEMFDELVMLGR